MENAFSVKLDIEPSPTLSLEPEKQHDIVSLREAVNVFLHESASVYYDTSAAWNMQPSLIAEKGVIYVYSDKSVITDEYGNPTNVPGIKIGDGSSFLIDMPFVGEEETIALAEHERSGMHISPEERAFWNNKVSVYIDASYSERLVLTTN